MIELFRSLFIEWKLDVWANVLQVVGFISSIGAFIIGLFIKSEINKLKTSYVFEKTIKKHIDKLKISASNFSVFLNDYDSNRNEIKTEISLAISELEDLNKKITFRQGFKSRKLVSLLKKRRKRPFIVHQNQPATLATFVSKYFKRWYQTNYQDIWDIYYSLIGIIRQMENIRINKKNTLQ